MAWSSLWKFSEDYIKHPSPHCGYIKQTNKKKSKFMSKGCNLAYGLKDSSLHLEHWKAFHDPLKFIPPQRSSTVNRSSLKPSSQEELYNHLATRIL